jgi:hypothetical protein
MTNEITLLTAWSKLDESTNTHTANAKLRFKKAPWIVSVAGWKHTKGEKNKESFTHTTPKNPTHTPRIHTHTHTHRHTLGGSGWETLQRSLLYDSMACVCVPSVHNGVQTQTGNFSVAYTPRRPKSPKAQTQRRENPRSEESFPLSESLMRVFFCNT